MKTNHAIHADLKKLGYGDEQIFEWVAPAVDNSVGAARAVIVRGYVLERNLFI